MRLAAAASWPEMQSAWSLNELTNLGPMSLSSCALCAQIATAPLSGSRCALIDSALGSPFLSALMTISALDLSTTILASASMVSSGSVHLTSSDALTDALARHCADALTSAWPSHWPWQVPLHSPLHSPLEPPVPALPAHVPSQRPWHAPVHFAPTSADALPSHSAAALACASMSTRHTAGVYLILSPACALNETFRFSRSAP